MATAWASPVALAVGDACKFARQIKRQLSRAVSNGERNNSIVSM